MKGKGEKIYPYWAAQLALRGISRAGAARALNLSVSALNKRLRGEIKLNRDEIKRLSALLEKEQQV
ncbi:MAG: helix-turn-helix domain-containing protein [Clostridiales bacterium]|nr:helix-turn-helix domain-containing protein [Clostridiales bacterium]